LLDEAIRRELPMVGFLNQPMHESHDYLSTLDQLRGVLM
jgi:flagellum-specific ATP synthase